VGNLEGKRPLGRPKLGWDGNIMMHLQDLECGGTDWLELAQAKDRWRALMNAIMNFRVP